MVINIESMKPKVSSLKTSKKITILYLDLKKNRKEMQLIKIRNATEDFSTNLTEIKRVLGE